MSGKQTFLTKGPFAMFFGGDDILYELSDKKSGKHLPLLYLVSTLFSITITGTVGVIKICTLVFRE